MTKQCSRCQTTRELSAFPKKRESYSTVCKICQRAYSKTYYERNKKRVLARLVTSKKKRTLERRRFILKILEAGCTRCKELDPVVLEFHHRDGRRQGLDLPVSRLVSASESRILEEVSKCEILCANCHARVHRAGWMK